MSSSSDTTVNPLSWLVQCEICKKNFHIKKIVRITKDNKKVVTLTYNNYRKYKYSHLKYFSTCNTKKCVTELNDKFRSLNDNFNNKYINPEDIPKAKIYLSLWRDTPDGEKNIYYNHKVAVRENHTWYKMSNEDFNQCIKKVELVKDWNSNDWKLNKKLKNDYNNDPFKRSIDKKTLQNFKLLKRYCETSDEWREVIRKGDEEYDRRMHEIKEKERKEKEKEEKERKEKEETKNSSYCKDLSDFNSDSRYGSDSYSNLFN